MGTCQRQGCKGWGDGMILLDATSATLCMDHRTEFDREASAADMCNDTIRTKGDEMRALALVYAVGDTHSIQQHENCVEAVIAHRMRCRAFVAEWMAIPVVENPATT